MASPYTAHPEEENEAMTVGVRPNKKSIVNWEKMVSVEFWGQNP